ncbi:hypothetical protein RIF29_14313 [Crotalaria pallida]|uniref:Uncharacterized protein n=1 Tax=Crotalaria pallida TaxID=3830 RepID=A0AAN9ICM6_CROPI
MRKKVDERIRTLIENGVKLRHRSMFVIIEDKSRDQDPVVRPIGELGPKALQQLLPEIPLWVKTPDYERVDWLNKFLLHMWPFLDKAICATIRKQGLPIFADYIGKYHIKAIEFDKLTLGTLPPTICGFYHFESQNLQYYLEKNLDARERELEREAELDEKAPKVKAKSKMSKAEKEAR